LGGGGDFVSGNKVFGGKQSQSWCATADLLANTKLA